MVKIKTKREMTLPELIQWGWKNGEEQRFFHGSKDGSVCFNDDSWVTIATAVEPDETFTFEVEEEITEETKIPTLITIANHGYGNGASIDNDRSITDVLKRFGTHAKDIAKAIYMLNNDMTMTLIWRNGEMVE